MNIQPGQRYKDDRLRTVIEVNELTTHGVMCKVIQKKGDIFSGNRQIVISRSDFEESFILVDSDFLYPKSFEQQTRESELITKETEKSLAELMQKYPYKCFACGYRFKSKLDLNLHRKHFCKAGEGE